MASKALALFAFESFEQFPTSVGEQLFDLIIRKGAVCFQAEHWHTALLVAASYYLAVELHGTLLALRTLAAGILAAEKSFTT